MYIFCNKNTDQYAFIKINYIIDTYKIYFCIRSNDIYIKFTSVYVLIVFNFVIVKNIYKHTM